jgi:hypothetical protein
MKQGWDCFVCGLKFDSLGQLDRHGNEKHPGSKWTCDLCKAFVTTMATFHKHMKLHEAGGQKNESLHICNVEGCESLGFFFPTSQAWSNHIKYKQPDLPRMP